MTSFWVVFFFSSTASFLFSVCIFLQSGSWGPQEEVRMESKQHPNKQASARISAITRSLVFSLWALLCFCFVFVVLLLLFFVLFFWCKQEVVWKKPAAAMATAVTASTNNKGPGSDGVVEGELRFFFFCCTGGRLKPLSPGHSSPCTSISHDARSITTPCL